MVSKAHLRRHVDDSQQVDFEATMNRPDLQQRTNARTSEPDNSAEQQLNRAILEGETATTLWIQLG